MSNLFQISNNAKVVFEPNASFSAPSNNMEVVLFSDSDNHLLPEEIRDFFILAKNRWKQLVAIKPEMLAAIRRDIHDFDGIKLTNLYGMGTAIGSWSAGPRNLKILQDPITGKKSYCTIHYSMSGWYIPGVFGWQGSNFQIYRSILHELGHALGLIGILTDKPGFNGNAAIFPRDASYYDEYGNIIWPDPNYTNTCYLDGEEYPKTLEAYREIHNTNNHNIPLWHHGGGGHWIKGPSDYLQPVVNLPYKINGETYPPMQHYDLMAYGPIGELSWPIITKLSIYHLLDFGGYYERNPGTYETINYIPPWISGV